MRLTISEAQRLKPDDELLYKDAKGGEQLLRVTRIEHTADNIVIHVDCFTNKYGTPAFGLPGSKNKKLNSRSITKHAFDDNGLCKFTICLISGG